MQGSGEGMLAQLVATTQGTSFIQIVSFGWPLATVMCAPRARGVCVGGWGCVDVCVCVCVWVQGLACPVQP